MLVAAMTGALVLGVAAPSAYPHGVGRKGARDKTSGTPVRNFKVSNSGYAANRHSDGIACEKR